MKDKYFVISLPRTGTKSLCKMAGIVGLSFKHVPSIHLDRIYSQYDFFADTPCFTYSNIEKLLEVPQNKFIYIDRQPIAWLESFVNSGLLANFTKMLKAECPHPINALDKKCLLEIFSDDATFDNLLHKFKIHKEYCLKISQDRLLVYNFSEKWDTFCGFLGTNIPEHTDIPIINRGTLYEKI